jgi:hypothetical protein
VSTTAPSAAASVWLFSDAGGAIAALLWLFLAVAYSHKRCHTRQFFAAVAVLAAAFLLSCGGGGSSSSSPSPSSGTPAGTYTLTLSAGAAQQTQSVSVALIVK